MSGARTVAAPAPEAAPATRELSGDLSSPPDGFAALLGEIAAEEPGAELLPESGPELGEEASGEDLVLGPGAGLLPLAAPADGVLGALGVPAQQGPVSPPAGGTPSLDDAVPADGPADGVARVSRMATSPTEDAVPADGPADGVARVSRMATSPTEDAVPADAPADGVAGAPVRGAPLPRAEPEPAATPPARDPEGEASSADPAAAPDLRGQTKEPATTGSEPRLDSPEQVDAGAEAWTGRGDRERAGGPVSERAPTESRPRPGPQEQTGAATEAEPGPADLEPAGRTVPPAGLLAEAEDSSPAVEGSAASGAPPAAETPPRPVAASGPRESTGERDPLAPAPTEASVRARPANGQTPDAAAPTPVAEGPHESRQAPDLARPAGRPEAPADVAPPPVDGSTDPGGIATPPAGEAVGRAAPRPPGRVEGDVVHVRTSLAGLVEAAQAAVRIAVRDGRATVRLAVEPPGLGAIEIRLRYNANSVSAELTAETQQAAQALVQASGELRRSLEAQGLVVTSLDVQQADTQAGSNAHREGSRPDAPARRDSSGLEPDDEPEAGPPPARTLRAGERLDVLA